jgi:hypothetical protein
MVGLLTLAVSDSRRYGTNKQNICYNKMTECMMLEKESFPLQDKKQEKDAGEKSDKEFLHGLS